MAEQKWKKVDSAFDFFTQRAATDSAFMLKELASFTQWNMTTFKTYVTKRCFFRATEIICQIRHKRL